MMQLNKKKRSDWSKTKSNSAWRHLNSVLIELLSVSIFLTACNLTSSQCNAI